MNPYGGVLLSANLPEANAPIDTRAELALHAEPLIAARAKERQGTRNDLNIPANLPGSDQRETRQELSTMSGVSARNISKVKKWKQFPPLAGLAPSSET